VNTSKPDTLPVFNPRVVDHRVQNMIDQEIDAAVSIYPYLDRASAVRQYRQDINERAQRREQHEAEQAARVAAQDAERAKAVAQVEAQRNDPARLVALLQQIVDNNSQRIMGQSYLMDAGTIRQDIDTLARLVLRLVVERNEQR
jgi:hypothetical protein